MKVRNGFVSNSSSSSFILHGVKINDEEGERIEEKYSWGELFDNGLNIVDNRYYFGGEREGYIIGGRGTDFEDGEIIELEPLTEERKLEIVEKLGEIGVEINIDDIKTYIQYVSNDNY